MTETTDDLIGSLLESSICHDGAVKKKILQIQELIKDKDEEIQNLKKDFYDLEAKYKKNRDDDSTPVSPRRNAVKQNSTAKDILESAGEEATKINTSGHDIGPSAFDKLFSKNVPHILENIFFSLNYKSYKVCLEVNSTWKELLTSESFQKNGKSLFSHDISNDEIKLWRLSRHGRTEEVKKLLSSGMLNANIYLTNGNDKSAPLFEAAERGHKEVVELLLKAGADPDKYSSQGSTPLNLAADRGYKEVVQLLLNSGADPDKTDSHGNTPLQKASVEEHEDVVKMLLEKGAKTDITNQRGWTPLYYASHNNNTDVVRLLLNSGADQNVANAKTTALLTAALWGCKDVVQMLLNAGADSNRAAKNGGRTPLMLAAHYGHEDVVQLLLDRGADPNKADIHGRTALSIAHERGHIDIAKMLKILHA